MRRNILVVDDDLQTVELVTFFLEQSGFVVRSCGDGFSAIAELENHDFDLLVLDINMPHVNGIKALKMIRASEKLKNLPVIMLTASGDKSDIQKASALGVSDYIVKPAKREDLIKRVERILGGKPQCQEIKFPADDPTAQAQCVISVRLKSLSKTGMVLESAVAVSKKYEFVSFDLPLFKDLNINLSQCLVLDCTPTEDGKFDYFVSLLSLPKEDRDKLGEWIVSDTFRRKNNGEKAS